MHGRVLADGGYAVAERKKIFLLPEYMDGMTQYAQLSEWGHADEIATLEITGSGYRALTHRDYLGSVLGLGLERDVLGDIAFTGKENFQARLFCEETISAFLCGELKRVGNDAVKIRKVERDDGFAPKREFQLINDTVASPRVDCVVAALCGISREKARNVLLEGIVEVDYEVEDRPDHPVSAPCLISVRGYGKYRLTALSDLTKKGRIRLQAEKYI